MYLMPSVDIIYSVESGKDKGEAGVSRHFNCCCAFTCCITLLLQKLDNQSLDLSDDEELREQMDMHSIIVSSISDEPLFTAEQVQERSVPLCSEVSRFVEKLTRSQS